MLINVIEEMPADNADANGKRVLIIFQWNSIQTFSPLSTLLWQFQTNDTLFLVLTKNAYKYVGPHGHPDLNGSCLQLLAIRSKSHPDQNSPPFLQSPSVFSYLC